MTTTSYGYAINLEDFRQTTLLDGFAVHPDTLADGQVMVRIDKIALTSNSISYVIAGKAGLLRYLDLFPAPEGQAHILCWGYGDVVHSKHPDVPEGERLYGFFPIASHIVLSPGKMLHASFTDVAPHRNVIAPFYNEYNFARKEPGYMPQFEDIVMLFRPLFGTSFLLESFCEDNDFFGADQIIVSSASAKTSIGFGYLLKKNQADKVKTIGLTSHRNRDFVIGLDCFDEVLTYDEVDALERGGRAIFFDVAGNRDVLTRVHNRLGDAIVYSGQVGQTHWDTSSNNTRSSSLPGARPVFWSGPDQVMKLRERHGTGGMIQQIQMEMIAFLQAAYGWINITHTSGADAIDARVKAMLDGGVNANEGVILSP